MGSMDYHKSSEEEANFSFAWHLVTGAVLPMAVKSAIELDLLQLIKKAGPGAAVSASQLAAQIPNANSNPDAAAMIDRLLRVLAANSVLNCHLTPMADRTLHRAYSLTPVCKYLTTNEDGVSLAPASLLNQDKVMMEAWYHLKDAVVEGGVPFDRAYGMPTFKYQATNPRTNQLFNQYMSGASTIIMKRILENYGGFEGVKTLVDVGGGTGASLKMILAKHPSIKGINFDLPHVVQQAASHPGMEHVGGDMFVSVPQGDTIFLKWICHLWSDSQCEKLLKKCYEALPENGKLIIVECILPKGDPESCAPEVERLAYQAAAVTDFIMLGYNPGWERSAEEFEALGKRAGFTQFHKACYAFGVWVMELRK